MGLVNVTRLYIIIILHFLEIQHHHIPAAGALRAVPFLPQPLLSCDGSEPVHTEHPYWLPLHILGAVVLCVSCYTLQRGSG